MQAVKFFIAFIYLSTFSMISAQNIEGAYFWHDAAGLEGRQLSLEKDNMFTYVTKGDLDIEEISKGYYLIKGDTLILMHSVLQDPFPSKFQVTEQNTYTKPEFGQGQKFAEDLALITLEVLDMNDRPLQNCNVVLKKGENMVSVLTSNHVGSVTISTQGKVIDNVFVFMFGFKPLKIDMDSFWGKSSSIKVALSNSNVFYNDKSYMEKFILESFNDKTTNIKSIEGNIVFVQ